MTAEDFYGWQAIHEAALNGHTECLALLLEGGAKVDSVAYNNNGPNTPLHYAARHGHIECVRLLLMHGADWRSVNNFGETPLHCTAMRGHVDCMQTLVQAGTNIFITGRLDRLRYICSIFSPFCFVLFCAVFVSPHYLEAYSTVLRLVCYCLFMLASPMFIYVFFFRCCRVLFHK